MTQPHPSRSASPEGDESFDVDWVVVDIEGTTSATAFVAGDLYDYARLRLRPWIVEHAGEPAVAAAVAQVVELTGLPARGADVGAVVAALHRWMDDDRKETPLKTLQGMIWADAFERGDLSAHFFDDVVPALRRWHAAGVGLAVFSSGSVTAQRGWFAHSPDGDLSALVGGFFDTVNAGPKREASSYDAIARDLGAAPGRILFLSDVTAELDGATGAGWRAVGLARRGEPNATADFADHPVVDSFDQIRVRRGEP